MLCSRWIHKLLGLRTSRNLRRRQAAQTRKPVRPILESLEERVTPNATVTQSAGGFTQLTGLVAGDTAANTDYVINITNSFTFTAGQQATISSLGSGSTLTIQGQNGNNETLTGNGNRLFSVTSGQNVTLDNLTLTGGSASIDGGALDVKGGNVSLNHVTIQGNTVTGDKTHNADGGGVFFSGQGTLTVKDSSISDNVAQGFNGASASPNAGNAIGGGVFVTGPGTVQIIDSTLSNNSALGGVGFSPTTAGSGGGTGGTGAGGGLLALGNGWSLTFEGDTISGNTAKGGAGGNGVNGSNGNGGNGGDGGNGGPADGGGLYVNGSGTLTILNDLAAPLDDPSTLINNTAEGGDGGTGGVGGAATSVRAGNGGNGGDGGRVFGGGLFITGPVTGNIGNTTFYHNSALGGDGAAGGRAGPTGSSAGVTGTNGGGGNAFGGGLFFNSGTLTLVNNTVAKNRAYGGTGPGGSVLASGGGIYDNDPGTTVTLDNNTITQNTFFGPGGNGGGIAIVSTTSGGPNCDPTLLNNLIQGNQNVTQAPADVENDLSSIAGNGNTVEPLTNATHNFITAVNPGTTVSGATNILNNSSAQLGSVVGVNGSGNPTGGPIYYPVQSGAVSINAGTTGVLGTIAAAEGHTPATDEIGDLRTTNGTASGSITLGAVQPLGSSTQMATAVVPANASVAFYGTNPSPAFQVSVAVNAVSGGSALGGTVSLTLVANNTSTPLGTADVGVNGVATVSVAAGALPANLQAGDYELLETYSGNASFASNNALATLTVSATQTTPTTSIVAGNDTVPAGSAGVTFDVGVSSSGGEVNGTGSVSVTVLVNGLPSINLGNFSVVNGTAAVTSTLIPGSLPVGTYQMKETFGGADNFQDSTGFGTLTVTTDQTTVVGGNASLNFYGATSPAFTLTVPVNSPEGTVNGGTVSVKLVANNTTTAVGTGTVTSGTASITVAAGTLPANLQPGSYQLIESYSGNSPFASSSGTGTLTVNLSPTTVAAGNASLNFYGSATSPSFQVAVGVNSPNGTVSGGSVSVSLVSGNTTTALGTASVSGGTATVSVAAGALPANLQPGTYQLVETYTDPAGGPFAGSTAQGTLTVNSSATTVAAGNASLAFYGSATSPAFQVAVRVNSPQGTVSGGTVSVSLVANNTTTALGTASVTGGTATVSVAAGTLPANLLPGTYQLVETYSGSPPFAGSGALGTLTVNSSASTSVVAGNGSVNYYGGSPSPAFQLVAAVNSPSGTVATGGVSFALVSGNTTTALGTASMSAGGTATLSVAAGALPANLQPGTYQLVETYNDIAGGQFGSASAQGTLTVISSATTVAAGNASLNFYGSATSPAFQVVVGVNSPDGTVGGGSVSLSLVANNTTTSLGTATVSGGTATVSVAAGTLPANLQPGTYQFVETYSGNSPFAGSTAQGTLTITSSGSTVVAGNAGVNHYGSTPSPAFSIAVAVNSPLGTVSGGTVSVSLVANNTTTALGTASVTGGTATVSVAAGTLPANLQPSTYQLVETYSGSPPFAGSGALGTLTVNSSASTSVVAGNGSVNYYGGSPSPAFQLVAAVNSPAGTVSTGSVSFALVSGNTTTALGTASMSAGGTATLSVAAGVLPANLQPGTYQLVETYNDIAGGQFGSTSASGALTVVSTTTTVVAGNAGVNLGSNSLFTIPVTVNSPNGTVNGGSVTISLIAGGSTINLTPTPVAVSGGVANVTVTSSAALAAITGLQAGTYQLIESYTGVAGGPFGNAIADGTLTVSSAATTVVPGNASVNLNSQSPFTISVGVNSPQGTVNSGSVSVSLVSGNTTTALGTGTVSGGTATVSVAAGALPANLLLGTYQLVETYSGSPPFIGSSASGTLTVVSTSTTVVAGNASVNLGSNSPFTVAVAVNSPNGTVNGGSVTISLIAGNTTVDLTPSPVSVAGGMANVSVSDPAALAAIAALPTGAYQLDETYTGSAGSSFPSSSAFGTLTVTAEATTVVPGSVSITVGSNSPFTIAVGVNSPAGTVNTGAVTVSLVSGTTINLTTTPVNVSGGVANVTVSDPAILSDIAALPAATYQLVESYSDPAGGPFSGTSAFGMLTVNAVPTGPTSIIPGNAVIDGSGGATTVPVLVNSPAGTVNGGTVTISLVNGGTSTVVGSASVSGGAAVVPVSFPANLSPGNYSLIETYSDGSGHFNGSSALGNLNVAPPPPASPSLPPQVADLELVLDAAALVLQNNPTALLELNLFSQFFLHESIPGTVPELLGAIGSLYPLTGPLGLEAILSGLTIASQLENSGQ